MNFVGRGHDPNLAVGFLKRKIGKFYICIANPYTHADGVVMTTPYNGVWNSAFQTAIQLPVSMGFHNDNAM